MLLYLMHFVDMHLMMKAITLLLFHSGMITFDVEGAKLASQSSLFTVDGSLT